MKQSEVVLITGCSTGLGRAMCEEMSRRGYKVIATARQVESLQGVTAELKLRVDVTEPESIQEAVSEVIRRLGRIDILINNAGYSVRSAVEEMEIDEFQNMFEVNVLGMIRVIKAVLPEMRRRGAGKIINMGSISGIFAQALNGGYCASKYSVEALTGALRLEVREFGIQVAVIEPGATETNFFRTLSAHTDKIMANKRSPYERFNGADLNYRKLQKRADPRMVAKQIADHITKKKLKMHYVVGLPAVVYPILKHCPNGVLEYFLFRHVNQHKG